MSDNPRRRIGPAIQGAVANMAMTLIVVLAVCAIPSHLQLWHVATGIVTSFMTNFMVAFTLSRVRWWRLMIERTVAYFSPPPPEMPELAQLEADLEALGPLEPPPPHDPDWFLITCPTHGKQSPIEACAACLKEAGFDVVSARADPDHDRP